jgi:predicted HAD superfamily hydrolase
VTAPFNVLYYLEPWIELDHPHFRLGSIRNHIGHEIKALVAAGHSVAILLGAAVAEAALRAGLIPSEAKVCVVSSPALRDIVPSYAVAARLIEDGALGDERLSRLCGLIRRQVGDFAPDVVVAYESASRFLSTAFPEAPVLNSTLGMFSREPYPETFCLDPFGTFRNSYLARRGAELVAAGTQPHQRRFMDTLRQHYLDGIMARHAQINARSVRGRFDRVVLLPLQVSPYFAFDNAFDADHVFSSQFDYLCWTMERISPDIGVYVTEHGYQPVIGERNEEWLKRRFPNLIYDTRTRDTRWSSQHVLQHVDGVVTVTSSVGLQAVFAGKHLCSVGRSHLTPLADTTDPADLGMKLGNPTLDRDGALHHLLTHYYPLVERHMRDGAWYGGFLSRAVDAFRTGKLGADIIAPIEDEDAILRTYLTGDREERLLRSLQRRPAKTTVPANSSRPSKSGTTTAKPAPPISKLPQVSLDAVKQEIDRAEIVSFDIFDTLLARTYAKPEAVWDVVAQRGASILTRAANIADRPFPEVRKIAARRVLLAARERGVEDVTLREIYSEIRKMLEISRDDAATLRRLELEAEFNCLRRRRSVHRLYEYALAAGKRVFFTSDMYLDKDFIEHVLSANGYGRRHGLLLSSDRGKLKKTGTLFADLLSEAGVAADRVLHIGDNPVSDVQRAAERGIRTILVPAPIAAMKANEPHSAAWSDTPDSIWTNFIRGMVAARLFDDIGPGIPRDSAFGGSAYRLGFAAAGPIVLQYAAWVLKQARRDGIEDVYFLSRDGWHVKSAYDMLAAQVPGAPRSHYLYASRRACITASHRSPEDVSATLELAFSATRVGDLLAARFDLPAEDISPTDFKAAGFAGADDLVTSKDAASLARTRILLERIAGRILDRTQSEREAYLAYLRKEGLLGGSRAAVVDIGHNGTLQRALSRLVGKPIAGYYYATFAEARSVEREGLLLRGCLLDFEDRTRSRHHYVRSIGMYEFLFLPPQQSFLRMRMEQRAGDDEPALVPEFVSTPEMAREAVAREVEQGLGDFLADASKTLGQLLPSFSLTPDQASALYAQFLEQPSLRDAMIVRDVHFADGFAGNTARPLIARGDMSDIAALIRASWWRRGAELILAHENTAAAPKLPPSKVRPERSLLARRLRKLIKNPELFVADSRWFRGLHPIIWGRRGSGKRSWISP